MTGPAPSPGAQHAAGPAYPPARRTGLVEQVAGHFVADPYRWLEDPDSDESRAWLAAQDVLTAGQLAALPARPALAARIAELTATGLVSSPIWRGERRFFLRREPGEEHATLITSAPGEPDRVLVNPMALDPSGATTLDAWAPDNEGRLLAYQVSRGGDEESVLQVMDVTTGEQAEGPIDRCRYTEVAWLPGGKSFYYVRRLPPEAVRADEAQYHRRVYLHTVGTPTEEDTLVFGEGRDKTDFYQVSVSWDGRWLAISAAQGTSPRNDVWLADLAASSPGAPALRVVQEGVDARTSVHVGRDGRLYVFTDAGAPRGRLAVADPGRPDRPGWQDLIGEDPEAVLQDYAVLDGGQARPPLLLVTWTRHAFSEITVHDLASGERRGAITVPGPDAAGTGRPGTISQITERPEGGHEAWFAYTDHSTPVTIYRYDARTGEVAPWARAPGTVRIPPVRTLQVTYRSADGTEVRMVVISPPEGPPPEGPSPAGRSPAGGSPADGRPAADGRPTADGRPDGGRQASGGRRPEAGDGGGTPAGDPQWVWGLRHQPAHAGLLPRRACLGGSRRRLRDRRAAGRGRGGRGVAPGRDARAQAARLRRLPRGRRQTDQRWLDHPRAARDLRRLERRPAGRGGADPVAGLLGRGGLLGTAARHGPL